VLMKVVDVTLKAEQVSCLNVCKKKKFMQSQGLGEDKEIQTRHLNGHSNVEVTDNLYREQ